MIGALVKFIFKIIYSVLALFNLQLTLFVLLVGAVLYFTGTLETYPALMSIFQISLIISVVYAIWSTLKKALGIDKKVKKSKGVQIVGTKEEQNEQQTEQQNKPQIQTENAKPRYFSVKQNPNYVMAEFNDRYELYYKGKNGLEKVRTDYKDSGEQRW